MMNPILRRGMNQELVLKILANRRGTEYVRVHRYEWNSNPEIRERLKKWADDNLFTPLVRDYMKWGCLEIEACWFAQIHMYDNCWRN